MNFREHLISTHAYLAPGKTLDGLSATDAERRVNGVPHSIADLVAHMSFWQDWWHARCVGQPAAIATSAAIGWPQVAPNSWSTVHGHFLEGLEQLAKVGDGDVNKPLTPAIEFPPFANFTIADALVHAAGHNAHHLGQVVTVRQLLGLWPPPAGSWTW